MSLNILAERIHNGNKNRGFWDTERNVGEMLMLVVTELSEALEAHRSGKFFNKANKINYLESEDMVQAFKDNVKDTFEDEIADAMIRLLDMCGGLGIDIDFHVSSKVLYNSTRPYKHGKKY
jgi:NTP pyrophosphatase (non-canonical NTP hydrolase)